MAEKKFSELTAKGTTIADTDLVAISESAGGGTYTSKSVTGANIKALVTDANLSTTDVTTNDVSTSKHGFAPKAPNDGTKFLDGTGAYDTVKDSDLSLSDITTNNVSTTAHGFTPKAPNDTTKFLRGDGTWAAPAAGGLTYFTEAQNTTAPNATTPVDSLTAVSAATNADFAIVPKGNGAILAAVPDSLTSGGNKRGQYAVDLQMVRNANYRIASGNRSVLLGGYNNEATNTYSIAGGESCLSNGYASIAIGANSSSGGSYSVALGSSVATGNYAVALGQSTATRSDSFAAAGGSTTGSGGYQVATGYLSTASANVAVSIGREQTASGAQAIAIGYGNTSSGDTSVALGRSNVSSGDYSSTLGSTNTANANYSTAQGYQSHVFGIIGRHAYASGQEGTAGDSQASRFVLHERTTDATATTLTTNSSAASTNNQVILSNQSGYRFKGTIIGKKSGTTDVAAWDIDGLIVRGANAAATTLSISNVNVVQNTPAWGTPTLAADTTNGGLRVQVTGAAATNIQWTATIETTEVIYA